MRSKMLLHELHPAAVHAPLALLPAAAVSDLVAVSKGDDTWARVGRRFWLIGTASALLAGVSGFAASQEVRLGEPRARDMTVLHGAGNLLITVAAVGLTAWRQRREPTPLSAGLGLAACGLAVYTASLGGKMVYEYGVGINAMPAGAPQGTHGGPALLSREAPRALVRDAVAGLRWVLARVGEVVTRRAPLAPGATGVGAVPYEMPGVGRDATHSGPGM
jgi:uncharacterized membrane protein